LKENHNVAELYQKITGEVSKVIIGKGEIELSLMLGLIAGGHVLIEGLPGTAKTKLAKTFANAIGTEMSRIQFTPDMMPADITGFYIYSPNLEPRFFKGPLFANIILADELNRTTPRTQSALLEAMQENQVTIEGKSYALPKPYIVIATQVPAGGEGTYQLTDVQTDRFMLMIKSAYPSSEEEGEILKRIDSIDQPEIKAVTNPEEIIRIQSLVKQVFVSQDIIQYITAIVTALRNDSDILWGPSVRASISMYKCARVMALLDGRDFVIPDDVKKLALNTTVHRIRIKPEAEMDDITPQHVIERTLQKIAVPKI